MQRIAGAGRFGTLVGRENHYNDVFREYPESAQRMDVFRERAGRVKHPNFGVNYDPSNALLAGDALFE